jgi:hypothetical protein
LVDQSSESRRLHGPHAVCHPDAVTRRTSDAPAADWAWLDAIDLAPASNGPAALRGEALARALAAAR